MALLAAGTLMCVQACTKHDDNAEVRMVWRPDSLVTGADSCIQRYYLKGDRLGSYVWCPPSATTYMEAEQSIEVILSRREAARLISDASKVEGGENALEKGIHTLQPGDAIIWRKDQGSRRGLKLRLEESPTARSLHEDVRSILRERRKSAMK